MLSDAFSKYLCYQSNYNLIINLFISYFNSGYNLIKNGNYLNINFDENQSTYPRYPYPFNIIQDLSYYNIFKIFNVTNDIVTNLDSLIIDQDVLAKKYLYKNYPPEDHKYFLNDINFQYTCFEKSKDLYNLEIYNSLINYKRGKNKFGFIINYDLTNPISNDSDGGSSFLIQHYLYLILRQIIPTSTNMVSLISTKVIENQYYGLSELKTGFNSYVTNNVNIKTDIAKIYTKNLYQFVNPTDLYIDTIATKIDSSIHNLITTFNSYVDTFVIDPIFSITEYFYDYLFNYITIDMLSSMYNNYSIFNKGISQTVKAYETSIYEKYMTDVDLNSMKDYMFLNYAFKDNPFKFLNLMQLNVKDYVENKLKPADDNTFDLYEVQKKLNSVYSNMNFTEFRSFIINNLTQDYIIDIIANKRIVELACYKYLLDMLDNFLEYAINNHSFDNMLDLLFDAVKNTGMVDTYFHWNRGEYLLKLYFKSLLRYALLNGELFPTFVNNYLNFIIDIIVTETLDFSLEANAIKTKANNLVQYKMSTMQNFIEDMLLSTINREILFNQLSFYLKDNLTIISPLATTNIKKGSIFTIEWESTLFSNEGIVISLLKNNVLIEDLTTEATTDSSGNGTYSWTVSERLNTGSDYRIKIKKKQNNVAVGDVSKVFNITS